MSVATVIGAGGPTGKEVVKALLGDERIATVRAVVRTPDKYSAAFPTSDKLELCKGDVTNAESLKSSIEGAQFVVFAASSASYWDPENVDNKGVGNVATLSKEAGVKRVVLVSSMLVTEKNRYTFGRMVLNNIRYGLMDNKLAGENNLRNSGVPYTVIRPGRLRNGDAGSMLAVGQRDDGKLVGRTGVTRADVARVVVASLFSDKAADTTFELVNASSPPTPGTKENLEHLFDNLEKGVWE
eukprot:comp22828_c0_seq1/m.35896 comp22828_c0_seq1/g.35896  ORF comp22828_c0_seq1/g.35896 comp22828_c0_seq1/m.35896 type:complete len:241 (-) comp22828_c0_seq1:599-1321(-)